MFSNVFTGVTLGLVFIVLVALLSACVNGDNSSFLEVNNNADNGSTITANTNLQITPATDITPF